MAMEARPKSYLAISLKVVVKKPRYQEDPDCKHKEYAMERPIFGGQKSGDYQCLRCGFTWDPKNPPPSLESDK